MELLIALPLIALPLIIAILALTIWHYELQVSRLMDENLEIYKTLIRLNSEKRDLVLNGKCPVCGSKSKKII